MNINFIFTMNVLIKKSAILLGSALFCLPLLFDGISIAAQPVTDSNTILLLHLDGDTSDSGPHNIRTSLHGSPEFVNGRYGKAIKLDGDNWVTINNTEILQPRLNSWTIDAWIKPRSQDQQPPHAYIASTGWESERIFALRISDGNKLVALAGGDTQIAASSDEIASQLYDGQWHHVAAVIDRAVNNTLHIYLDGKELNVAPTTQPASLVDPADADGQWAGVLGLPSISGESADHLNSGYVGLIDEVRISSIARVNPLTKNKETDDTVLHLTFDGHLKDGSNFKHTTEASATTFISGKWGKAAHLDGTGAIQVGEAVSLQPLNHSWTIEAWIRPEVNQSQSTDIVSGLGELGRRFGIRIAENKKLEGLFHADESQQSTAVSRDVTSILFDGQWHSVAAVLDRDNGHSIRIYLDGENVTQSPASQPLPLNGRRGQFGVIVGETDPENLGVFPPGFKGAIDEVRISRFVREPYVIQTAPPYNADRHTALLLHFDGDNAKDALRDSSIYGNKVTVHSCGCSASPPCDCFTFGASGKWGESALLIEGDVLESASSFQLMPGNNSMTIETWIKPDEVIKNRDDHTFIFGNNEGKRKAIAMRISENGTKLHGLVFSGNHDYPHDTPPNPRHVVVESNKLDSNPQTDLFDGEWHKVALVIDRSRGGELRLYVDEHNVTSEPKYQPYPLDVQDNKYKLLIGKFTLGGNVSYVGSIDEFRVSTIVRPEYRLPSHETASLPAEHPQKYLSPGDSRGRFPLSPSNTIIVWPAGNELITEVDSAQFLQKYLRLSLGVTTGFKAKSAARLTPTELNEATILAVGNTEWVHDEDMIDLERNGFRIMRKGNVIQLAGERPDAIPVAVTYFLEKFIGLKIYMPTDLFTFTPDRPVTDLKGRLIDETVNPYVKIVSSTGFTNFNHAETLRNHEKIWTQMRGFSRSAGDGHSMNQRFPTETFNTAEWRVIYPVYEDASYVPDSDPSPTSPASILNWQPRFSLTNFGTDGRNRLLVDAAEHSFQNYFLNDPWKDDVAFTVQDTSLWSEDPDTLDFLGLDFNCNDLVTDEEEIERRRVACNRRHTSLYWNFIKESAERLQDQYPSKNFIGSAYSRALVAPEESDFSLPSNVIVRWVFKASDVINDKRFDRDPGSYILNIHDWAKSGKRFGFHDWAQGKGYFIPRIYTKHMKDLFRHSETIGAPIRYVHVEAYPNWGLDGPKLYLLSKLYQNPETDIRSELRSFCHDLFGSGGRNMVKYFNTLEKFWNVNNGDNEAKIGRYETQFLFLEHSKHTQAQHLLKQARKLLTMASRKVTEDSKEAKRIKLFSKTFKLTELYFDLANSPDLPTFEAKANNLRKYVAGKPGLPLDLQKILVGQDPILKDSLTIHREPKEVKKILDLSKDPPEGTIQDAIAKLKEKFDP